VILAIGERVDSVFTDNAGLELNRDGTVRVDPHSRETSLPSVFAGGDVVTGASNLSNAMSLGKRAAAMMDAKLMGEQRFAAIFPTFDYGHEVPQEPQGGPRNLSPTLAPNKRTKDFSEVMLGYSEQQTATECLRCLRCDVKETA
jgi:NADPH-dependent glutamate synthase beta subunit-like oxidoreductase